MALHFLLDDPTGARVGDAVTLTGSEAHHAAAVRRVRSGELVTVGDGRGAWLTGECEAVTPREVVVRITHRIDTPAATPRIVLAQALAKGDRDELAVQAATELGASGVIPWSAERSVTRWDAAKAEKGRARWEAIVREASKQSIRAWVPSVEPLHTPKQLAALETVLVLDPTATTPLTAVELPESGSIHLVVGPEGGISEREFEFIGGTRVRLGAEVLRTSTAGPAALAVLNARLGRW